VKPIMGLLKPRRKKPVWKRRRPSRAPTDESRGPKNGWLTLAVAVSILGMMTLAALNIRFIRDPAVALKAFGSPAPGGQESWNAIGLSPPLPSQENKRSDAPQELTFYTRLTHPEDPPGSRPGAGEVTEIDLGTGRDYRSPTSHTDPKRSSHVPAPAVTSAKTANKPVARTDDQANLPTSKDRNKKYSVQVGAFSTPAIARQWALVWKERGYVVSLKPVARPQTGVIYRLYLGSFPSEKQADELVKRLTAREGINAFRVAVWQ